MKNIIASTTTSSMVKLAKIRRTPAYLGRTIRPDTVFWSGVFYHFARLLNLSEYFIRKQCARRIAGLSDVTVEDEMGYRVADFSGNKLLEDCIELGRSIAEQRNYPERLNEFKKSFLCEDRLDLYDPVNEAIVQFAVSERMLAIVSGYLGTIPVIEDISIWFSENKEFAPGRSQEYHLDGEDVRQLKCIIPLEEITRDCGPMTILPALRSSRLYKLFKQAYGPIRNQKFSDGVVYEYVDNTEAIPLTGKVGDVIFVDTCRCYHFGSRPGSKRRLAIMIHYTTAFSINVPFWGREDKRPIPFETQNRQLTDLVTGLQHRTFRKVNR